VKLSRRAFAYTAIACALVAVYAAWAPKGMSRGSAGTTANNNCVAQVSPQGTYRVDICRPSLPYVSFSKEMPRFVRFYDQRNLQILGESNIVDLAGRGEVFWPKEGRLTILVGGGDNSPEVAVKDIDGSK
jgi:hypothetical protein